MNDFTVSIDEYLPLRDVVFQTLRKAILKGELKPGERLMEIALAEKMGVSRTPVREAIRKLELEGLVVTIPRRGAHVAQITIKDLNDVLEVRLGLEYMAIDKACCLMQQENFDTLQEAKLNFEQIMRSGSLTELAEADVLFHETIYKASDNQRLLQLLNNLREAIYRYRIEYLKDKQARSLLVREHEEIYKAMCDRDAVRAKDIMSEHIENQRLAIIRSIDEAES